MYKSALVLVSCFLTSLVYAQEVIELTKQIKCSDVQTVMNYFQNTHKEVPAWVGKTVHGTHITLLTNKETRSWTMVEYDTRVACVLGAGEEKTSSGISI